MSDFFVSDSLAALQEMVNSGNGVTADTESFLPFIKQAALERREFKERWLQAVKYSPIAICIISETGYFIEVNPATCALFKRDAEELKALTWQELTHPDDLQEDETKAEQVSLGEYEFYSMIKRYIMPDGSYKPAQLSSVAGFVSETTGEKYFIVQIIDLELMESVVNKVRLRYGS